MYWFWNSFLMYWIEERFAAMSSWLWRKKVKALRKKQFKQRQNQ